MQHINLYNSLTRRQEPLVPQQEPRVTMYTCGPTVYNYVSIGNWRTYMLGDMIVRSLEFLGYTVDYVMNITDVGHLTGDNEGDADTGEDRLEKAKRREGKTAWSIAELYADDFIQGSKDLHLIQPRVYAKATEHIQEQIALIQSLTQKGLTYQIDDGVYFDTVSYEALGYVYGELSTLDQLKQGARVEWNPQKKDARDFALWKLSPQGETRDMEWQSPWGVGFPGWHIECSAMSMHYLGETFDIHVGGEDLRSTHHPNEIAQAQGATGCAPFVRHWVHGAFLLVDGGRMGKSLGNAYTLHDIRQKGYSPMALRYFYMTGHYHSQLNFTWEALASASTAYERLVRVVVELSTTTDDGAVPDAETIKRAQGIVADDLAFPRLLALVWEVVKSSDLSPSIRYATLIKLDELLGFDLLSQRQVAVEVLPESVAVLVAERQTARLEHRWSDADRLRDEIHSHGYTILDTKDGMTVTRNIVREISK